MHAYPVWLLRTGSTEESSGKISESRSGILFAEGEIVRLYEILVLLVKLGQSINQIYLNHEDTLMCSEKTPYNYVCGCLFDIRNINLARKVKYCSRYKEPKFNVDLGYHAVMNYI